MKVFLSHAISDKVLIAALKKNFNNTGLKLLIAEHNISIVTTITDKIEAMIKESQVALFLLTERGDKSKFVQQEIGYVQSIKKPALYIVQKGKKVTGFAYGKDYIELDPEKPHEAIKKAINKLIKHWHHIEEIKKKDRENAGLVVSVLIAFALFGR